MASLEHLLYPLPIEALGFLAVFWDSRDPEGSAERVRVKLMHQKLIGAVTTTHVCNVFHKLPDVRPELLPLDVLTDMPRLRCLTTRSNVCRQPVTAMTEVRARMLTLHRGLVPINVEEG